MKVLIVCSINSGIIPPFISDQVKALLDLGIQVDYFTIRGKGITGYLKNLPNLKRKITNYRPDIIHAHNVYSSLLSILQRKVKVVITFHGSDINQRKSRIISMVTSIFSTISIYVSEELALKAKSKYPNIIPCGIDFSLFYPRDRTSVRNKLGLHDSVKYVLFSSGFERIIKNYPLAKRSVEYLETNSQYKIEMIELKNYTRNEVALLMNAVDVALVTSFAEGSPQFIKEALACNCPIVSTDVGDVRKVIDNTSGCYICSYDPKDVAEKILKSLMNGTKTIGREKIKYLDNKLIAKRILSIYKKVLDE